MIYFSKSTNGFFFDGINSDMPADIVEISTDLYNELIAGQQEGGKLITSDENGLRYYWRGLGGICGPDKYHHRVVSI